MNCVLSASAAWEATGTASARKLHARIRLCISVSSLRVGLPKLLLAGLKNNMEPRGSRSNGERAAPPPSFPPARETPWETSSRLRRARRCRQISSQGCPPTHNRRSGKPASLEAASQQRPRQGSAPDRLFEPTRGLARKPASRLLSARRPAVLHRYARRLSGTARTNWRQAGAPPRR